MADEMALTANKLEDRLELHKLEREHDQLKAEVEEMKHEEHEAAYEHLEHKLHEIKKEGTSMNGILPVANMGSGNNWGEGLGGILIGALLGGGLWGNNRLGATAGGAALGLSEAAVINATNAAKDATVSEITNINNALSNANAFGNVYRTVDNAAAGINQNLATLTTRLAEQNTFTQAQVMAVKDQLCAMGMSEQAAFAAVQAAICANGRDTDNKFFGVQQGLNDNRFAMQAGLNQVAMDAAKCCCETDRNIDNTRASLSREMEQGFCATNANILASQNTVLGKMADYRQADLEKENCILRGELSQERQTFAFQRSQDEQTKSLTQINAALTAIALKLAA